MASEKPISVGDLVMVVRPLPCGCTGPFMGMPFVVAYLEPQTGERRCIYCKTTHKNELVAKPMHGKGFRVSRLIRIDPPAQPETVRTEDEVTA